MQDKITINPFDPDSIDEAIKKLEKRKERIHKCAEKLIQRLTDLGVEKAQELVPVDTGTQVLPLSVIWMRQRELES